MSTGYDILSATATARFLGRCTACDRPVAAIVEGHGSDTATIACPDCAGTCPAERLYGTIVAAHCNAACEGARGPVCECACGGSNHGGAWEQPGEMLASQIAAYRADKARRAAEAAARRARKVAARQDSRTLWAAAHVDVVEWLGHDGNVDWSDFLTDLADQLDDRGELTVGQVAAVRKSMARQAERDARRAAEAATARPVVAGKGVEVTGEVVKVDVKDNPYGYGSRVVMTVRDDRGFKVWGTVPGSLRDEVGLGEMVGRRVRFTASVEASDRDETFGFFKGPRRAEVLDLTGTAA